MSMSAGVAGSGTSTMAGRDKRGYSAALRASRVFLDGLDQGGSPHSPVLTSSSARVLAELAKQPNGARGEVMFKFPNFGHSMAYEIVDGVPHIFDSQKGTLYNASTKYVESKWDGFTGAEIRRLDNVPLDLNFLSRWATNTGSKPQAPRVSKNPMADAIDEVTPADAASILTNLGIKIPGVNK
jgi:hypothetical protein